MPVMGLEPRPPHYESDLQPTAPRPLDITDLTFKLESHFIKKCLKTLKCITRTFYA